MTDKWTLFPPRAQKRIRFDVSVSSSVDTGVIEMELCYAGHEGPCEFPMDYASALTLRDMLTDALKHQDAGGHANMATPIESVTENMSYRLARILKREGIRTFGDLMGLDAVDLLDFRGFGVECLREASELLVNAGFDAPEWPEDSQHYPHRPKTRKDPR